MGSQCECSLGRGYTTLILAAWLQWGTFLFFAGCVAVMTACVAFLLPETKGVPLEEVNSIWEQHPVWCKAVGRHAKDAETESDGPDCPKGVDSEVHSMQ